MHRGASSFAALVMMLGLCLFPNLSHAHQNVPDDLTKEDQSAIIKLSLAFALVEKNIPDYNFIKDLENIPISDKNISAELLPALDGIKLVLLTSEEIAERAEADGNYIYYLEFTEFKVKDQRVIVTLTHNPKYAKQPREMAFGGYLQLEWRKGKGGWRLHNVVRLIV